MSNYNAKINLAKLEGFGKVTLQGKSGTSKRCVVLPIDDCHLFEGKDGTYLDLTIIETNNSQYGDTHFITRGKSQEEREQEKATGERLRLPILGNLKPFGSQTTEGEEYTYQKPSSTTQNTKTAQNAEQKQDNDDLPFN